MNVIVRQPRTLDEFLLWEGDGSDAKYEFVDGRPVMLPSGTDGHSQIVTNLVLALSTRLDRTRWRIDAGQFGVRMGETYRIPDVMVRLKGGPGDRKAARHAVFIAEVLSESSAITDLRRKASEYLAIPELREYLVLSQDAVCGWLWSRLEGEPFPHEPEDVRGPDASLVLSGLGARMPLGEVYFDTEALGGRSFTTTDPS
jgi:Uma2 family endonuclease